MKKKENRGITLIALVITIIVLLILVAVSIATLTGENGILTQAENAKKSDKRGEIQDEFALIANEWIIDKNTNSKTLGEFLDEKLKEGKITNVEDNGNGTYTIKSNGYQTIINQNGEIDDLFNPEEWDKTATSEDCFIWEDTTIIGLNMDKLSGVEKIVIPSKCTKIRSDYSSS